MEQCNSEESLDLNQADETVNLKDQAAETLSQTQHISQSQLQWTNNQVCHLERQLLLNNNAVIYSSTMSNWSKVILSALSVLLPGIGQLMGIILGLVFVSNDVNSDKRSFGAALLTVSIVVFMILLLFWYLFALALGPTLY